MSPPNSRRTAAIARLAGIAATMAAAPAIAASLAGSADAAVVAPEQTTVVGAAAQAHLENLFAPTATTELASAHGVQKDTRVPNPFHQFSQFHEGPFRQGQPFGQDVPFHQAPTGFVQLVDP
ncbi:hypothetical protein VMT65_12885 [Nocardia sp. CDC153]|uniref:hypothetical protein n=1 Tax=Nocardia sp. CDC153 TaxID=3112167 RepID=UPI002DBD9F6A|nr:hypothetical protein [Nocardia sp. CDC153]MEC3953924.1 hypothetical protein [Nocardia sp. CDC153]